MYDVHRLRLLRELRLRGTLAAVGAALGYSPSAISHQLAVLEREVGVPLLEPVGRGVRLTATADVLVGHAEAVLRELERAEAGVAASRGAVMGTVRIATFQTAAHTIVPRALAALTAQHPSLDVRFSHIDAPAAIPGLVAREFDVVLSERYPGEPATPRAGVLTDELARDALRLAVPDSWPGEALSDLADAPWIMEHVGTNARAWSDAMCRGAGFEPRVAFETADVLLHAQLIDRGLAAGFLPDLVAARAGGIRLHDTGRSRTIESSVRAGSETSPAIAAVRAALHRAVA